MGTKELLIQGWRLGEQIAAAKGLRDEAKETAVSTHRHMQESLEITARLEHLRDHGTPQKIAEERARLLAEKEHLNKEVLRLELEMGRLRIEQALLTNIFMKTNLETVLNVIGPHIAEAREWVRRHGWQGEQRWCEENFPRFYGQPRPEGRKDPLSAMLMALDYATLEAYVADRRWRTPSAYNWPAILRLPAFIAHCEYIASLLNGDRDTALSNAVMTVQEAWQDVLISRSGNQVYEPSLGLAAQLRDTEVRGLTTDDVRLPFPAVYIKVPNDVGLYVQDPLPLRSPGKGAALSWSPLTWVSVVEQLPEGDEPYRWTLRAMGGGSNEAYEASACLFFCIDLPSGMPLADAIEAERQRIITADGGHLPAFSAITDEWFLVFKWAMNVILYTTLSGNETHEEDSNKAYRDLKARIDKLPRDSKKRDRLKDDLRKLSPERRIYLGRSVNYKPGNGIRKPGSKPTPTELATLVCGHWKQQVHGEARALRKRIFIEPYWRNADGLVAEKVTRIVNAPEE